MPKVNFPSEELIQRIHNEIMADVERVHVKQANDHNNEQCMQCAMSDGFKASPAAVAILDKFAAAIAPVGSLIDPGVKAFAVALFSLGLQVGRAELSDAKSIAELEKLVGETKVN